jgi:hypothetical protein
LAFSVWMASVTALLRGAELFDALGRERDYPRASDLVITTYALATRDRDTLAEVKWERIALDEAQNIKDAFHVSPLASEALDALLRQFSPAPVEVGERNLAEVLAGAYVTLAHAAQQRALCE